MAQLEKLMTAKKGLFDASSVDTYAFSVDIVCTSVHFDKAMNSEDEYICMILIANGSEIQIRPEIIEEIYLDEDGTITIEFNITLPDLEIKYRD